MGCWGPQPLLPHRKSQFSSIPPFTQSLFVHPPRTALTQTDAALSCERPADLLGCRRGRGGQRLLRRPDHAEMPPSCVQNSTGWAAGASPPGRQGRTTKCVRCCDIASPQSQLSLLPGTPCISQQAKEWPHGQPQANGHTRAYKFPKRSCPQAHTCIFWAGTEDSRKGTGTTGDRQRYPQPPTTCLQRGGHAECFVQTTCRGHGFSTGEEGWVRPPTSQKLQNHLTYPRLIVFSLSKWTTESIQR